MNILVGCPGWDKYTDGFTHQRHFFFPEQICWFVSSLAQWSVFELISCPEWWKLCLVADQRIVQMVGAVYNSYITGSMANKLQVGIPKSSIKLNKDTQEESKYSRNVEGIQLLSWIQRCMTWLVTSCFRTCTSMLKISTPYLLYNERYTLLLSILTGSGTHAITLNQLGRLYCWICWSKGDCLLE